MNYIEGIALPQFEESIRVALGRYSEITGGRVTFDLDAAIGLEITPSKPNSARSVATMRHLGVPTGSFVVIAFAPGDGTGDESTYALTSLQTGEYPRDPKIVPRSKRAVRTEAHLPLASFAADTAIIEPRLFAGSQELLGLDGDTVRQIGVLGQSPADFKTIMAGRAIAQPSATLTTGYNGNGERFADPHAVYNNPELRAVQVCGFVAVSPEIADRHPDLFCLLGAIEPTLR